MSNSATKKKYVPTVRIYKDMIANDEKTDNNEIKEVDVNWIKYTKVRGLEIDGERHIPEIGDFAILKVAFKKTFRPFVGQSKKVNMSDKVVKYSRQKTKNIICFFEAPFVKKKYTFRKLGCKKYNF